MKFAVDQAWWFAAAAVIVPLAVLAWRWFAAMGRARRWSAIVARAVLLALVAAMLAGLSLVRQTDKLAVIAVLDVSDSVERFVDPEVGSDGTTIAPVERMRRWLERAARDRGADDLLGIVVFDGRATAIAAPTNGEVFERSLETIPFDGTYIASALRFASGLAPPDARTRIVLFSDGNQTQGDAARMAERLTGDQGISVDVVPLEYDVASEVLVESVDAPPSADEGSAVTVRVTLRSTGESVGTLRLVREGEEVDINGSAAGMGRRVRLGPGLTTELIEVELPPGRIHRFEAVFEPDERDDGFAGDTILANNQAEAFTLTPGRGSVLIVDGVGRGLEEGAGATLAQTLRRTGSDVTLLAPEAMPDSLLGLQGFDLIMLQNVPAEALSEAQHEYLAAHVRDLGGGLVMIGGPDSFGAGGWKGTAIEPILPVRLDLPERAVMPEAAVVFVLDNSGSMSFDVMGSVRNKMRIANEAAALAVQTLDKADLLGVITFNSGYDVLIPLAPNSDPRRAMQKILGVGAGGGTNAGPALEEARRQLNRVDAKIKHIILLSDGRSQGAEGLPDLAADMRREGIRVTTIAVGEDADEQTMDQIAKRGGGSFHSVLNPNTLPRVFVRAVRVIRQPLIREQPFVPVVSAGTSPLLTGVSAPPALGGLVLTQKRDEPTVTTAMATPQGEPVLAQWNVEIGQVVAFTSDASGNWSGGWLPWEGYERLWTNIVRTASRRGGTNAYDMSLALDGDRLNVRMEAFSPEGAPIDMLDVPASIYGPDGEVQDVTLTQTGPGVYEATARAGQAGSYIAVLKPSLEGQRLPPAVGGASIARGSELRSLRSNAELLREIAEITGGRVLSLDAPGQAALFDRRGTRPRRSMEPIWRTLLIWSIVVLMLDIGTRRIAWDRLVSREFGADLRREALEAVRDRSGQVLAAIGGLAGKGKKGDVATALGEEDAQRVADEELERRRQQRLAAIRAARERVAQEGELGQGPVEAEPARETGERGTIKQGAPEPDGLLAAKRRARERFGGEG